MALAWPDVVLFHRLRSDGFIPSDPAVLELGQANWYGDVPESELRKVVEWAAGDDRELMADLSTVLQDPDLPWRSHAMARLFYRALLRYRSIRAVDRHGPPGAVSADLNFPLEGFEPADVVINTGTAEHVFDIARVLRTCHDLCRLGGIMVHVFPLTGWVDHGFWAVNPTLLADLAGANGYSLVGCCLWRPPEMIRTTDYNEILAVAERSARDGRDLSIHLAWQRVQPGPFVIPMQGRYAR